ALPGAHTGQAGSHRHGERDPLDPRPGPPGLRADRGPHLRMDPLRAGLRAARSHLGLGAFSRLRRARASAILVALFVWRQALASRPTNHREPFMDTTLFSIASFRNGNIATTIIGLGEYGIIAVLPLWLVFTMDYTAVEAGLALVPIAIGSFLA